MKRIVLFIIASLLLGSSYAQDESPLRKKQFNLEDDIAISGYDPVAYFTPGKAIKGSKDFALVHQGVTYYFLSAVIVNIMRCQGTINRLKSSNAYAPIALDLRKFLPRWMYQ